MTLDLFNQWGLTGFDYSYVFLALAGISILFLILVIIQMAQFSKLKKKYRKFMTGKDAKTLEGSIQKLFEDNKYIRDLSEENKKSIRKINKDMEYCFNKVGIVRYDAFQQMGGMLSFSIALLNDRNNGFILNSVHSTEGCYSYIKEVKNGMCETDLSNEEKDALLKAMKEE
ncbi:MAG: DUF4446 family protein [Lachnospiraceae bacterium]|nr:DUF4446 family protein [Lachnospiraceae bacterium]